MNDHTIGDWIVPALGVSALAVWVVILRRALRDAQPSDFRVFAFATFTIVAAAIAFSSLTFPSLIGPDLSRGAVVFARATLLVGGLAVLRFSRRRM